jgi:hypothetical protein
MSLKDTEKRLMNQRFCKLARVLQSFDKDDRSVFEGWVKNGMPYYTMHRILSANGTDVGDRTIKHHLHGGCVCPADAPFKGAVS